MKIIIVDLEFENQAKCFEVIQIGAVVVDLVRSTITPMMDELIQLPEGVVLSPYISNLTGIQAEDLDKARTFKEVFRDFWGKVEQAECKKRIGGWGADVDVLIDQSVRYGVKAPQRLDSYDVKQAFNFFRTQVGLSVRHKTGLQSTLKSFGLTFKGSPHNAYDDAYNTARLLLKAVKYPNQDLPQGM